MGERARIARFFAPLAAEEAGSFFLTDDAAVVMPPSGQQLVITTDSVFEGIHVLRGATPQQFAQKLVRRNLSDLAAMGATPWRYTLNVHTPHNLSDAWFAAFATALAQEQTTFGLVLIGGDSTSGGDVIHLTMTCFGLLSGLPLRRNGAMLGDTVYVSGNLGGAAYALSLLQHKQPVEAALATRYHCPEPRLGLGTALSGVASSAIDISDGLVADAGQICVASSVGMRIESSALPLQAGLDARALLFALSGGDDYELCFTAPANQHSVIEKLSMSLGIAITRIGVIVAGDGVHVIDANGAPLTLAQGGYEH
ncbi:MAG: thiamine-phosphate kinase [Rickettsiales bacterium]